MKQRSTPRHDTPAWIPAYVVLVSSVIVCAMRYFTG